MLKSHAIAQKDYTIGSQIGEGAFSIVYSGNYKNTSIAIKSARKKGYRSLMKEQALLEIFDDLRKKNANHEGVDCLINYYGYRQSKGTYHLILEQASMGSLDDLIFNSKYQLNINTSYQIIKEMTAGLSFLHDASIIHCDLKTANILIHEDHDKNIHAKLCDFGMSKFKTEISASCGFAILFKSRNTSKYFIQYHHVRCICFSYYYVGSHYKKRIYKDRKMTTWDDLREHIGKLEEREVIPDNCPVKIACFITLGLASKPECRPSAQRFLKEMATDINTVSIELTQEEENLTKISKTNRLTC